MKWKPGPGLLTGAADEDPSNIATYSQTGAQFSYQLVWAIWVFYPLVAAIQEVSARIGRTTGRGLVANFRRAYPRPLVLVLIAALLVANVVNIGADLLAMAAALKLLLKGPRLLYAVMFGVLSVAGEVFVSYRRYARLLSWLSLVLLSYVATAFLVHVRWALVARAVIPHLQMKRDFLMALVAIAGTTISPYLFFWQSGQEVELQRETPGQDPLVKAPEQASPELARIRWDTYIGMGLSQAVALFIMLTAAATLAAHGITHVDTAAQAASALQPLAGRLTSLLFAVGLVATGLLAVPALAAACAYAVAEGWGWPEGLARKPRKAKRFYAVVAGAMTGGLALDLLGVPSMKALYLSAVLNGLISVPIMVMMLWLASDPRVMGAFVLPRALRWIGWIAAGAMAVAALGLVTSWLI